MKRNIIEILIVLSLQLTITMINVCLFKIAFNDTSNLVLFTCTIISILPALLISTHLTDFRKTK